MQDRKLEQALEIYFQENPDRESDKYQEIQKYLKLRIRSVMELLIENEDTERMELITAAHIRSIKKTVLYGP